MISASRLTLPALLVLLLQLVSCSLLKPQDPAEAAATEPEPIPAEAAVLFDASVSAIRDERWPQAENQLLALQERFGEYPAISLNLGIVYLAMEQTDSAEVSFRQAIASDPAELEAYNHLGAMLRREGRFTEAEALYLDALEIQPEHADTHLNLGILYDLYLIELNKARFHYEAYQAQQDDPDPRVAAWIVDIEHRIARGEAAID